MLKIIPVEILSLHKVPARIGLPAILRFNINVDPRDVREFVETDALRPDSYLHPEHYAHRRGVHFDQTIGLLQDINTLIIVFKEEEHDFQVAPLCQPSKQPLIHRMTRRRPPNSGRQTKRVKR